MMMPAAESPARSIPIYSPTSIALFSYSVTSSALDGQKETASGPITEEDFLAFTTRGAKVESGSISFRREVEIESGLYSPSFARRSSLNTVAYSFSPTLMGHMHRTSSTEVDVTREIADTATLCHSSMIDDHDEIFNWEEGEQSQSADSMSIHHDIECRTSWNPTIVPESASCRSNAISLLLPASNDLNMVWDEEEVDNAPSHDGALLGFSNAAVSLAYSVDSLTSIPLILSTGSRYDSFNLPHRARVPLHPNHQPSSGISLHSRSKSAPSPRVDTGVQWESNSYKGRSSSSASAGRSAVHNGLDEPQNSPPKTTTQDRPSRCDTSGGRKRSTTDSVIAGFFPEDVRVRMGANRKKSHSRRRMLPLLLTQVSDTNEIFKSAVKTEVSPLLAHSSVPLSLSPLTA